MTREELICWNDSTVLKMAQTILERRAWEELPILSDACQEAGCAENSGIVNYLKGLEAEWVPISGGVTKLRWYKANDPYRWAEMVLHWIITGEKQRIRQLSPVDSNLANLNPERATCHE